MSKLATLVDTKSEAFEKNTEVFSGLVDELRKHSAEARRGGGEKAQRRHRDRGKLPFNRISWASRMPLGLSDSD